ncbi:MAG: GspMb/PilO family protein, partial [Phycisphaerae bacterium]|nr:GspMb/PilO family protein [Phycisphaerae bacterium]
LLFLGPQAKLKEDLAKQLAQKRESCNFLVEAATDEFQAKQKEQIAKMQADYNTFVVDSDSASNLTLDISRLIDNKTVSSLSITPRRKSGPEELPNCSKICEDSVNLSFNSGFSEFARILNALERNEPVMFVDEFSIERSSQGAAHKASMDLTFFITKTAQKKS